MFIFDAHKTIERLGYEQAWRDANSKFERVCLSAAKAVCDSSAATDAIHASLIVACLPHRRLSRIPLDGQPPRETLDWVRTLGESTYSLESGYYDDGSAIGIPFGSKARMILLYLHEHAARAGSPVIDVVPSMHAWMQSMNIRSGGMTYRQVAEQARRISGCLLNICAVEAANNVPTQARFIDALLQRKDDETLPIAWRARDLDSNPSFPERIVLNEIFYRAATAMPMLLCRSALRQIVDNSWAIDLYIWLAYQLPKLSSPHHLTWNQVHSQLGVGYKYPRQMKATFIMVLPLVLAIYREARVEIDSTGLLLLPSPAPIAAS